MGHPLSHRRKGLTKTQEHTYSRLPLLLFLRHMGGQNAPKLDAKIGATPIRSPNDKLLGSSPHPPPGSDAYVSNDL